MRQTGNELALEFQASRFFRIRSGFRCGFSSASTFARGRWFESRPRLETATARPKHFATSCYSFWINALRLIYCSAYAVQTTNRGRLGTATSGCNLLSMRELRSSNPEALSQQSIDPDFPDGSIVSAWRLRLFLGKPSVSDDFLPKRPRNPMGDSQNNGGVPGSLKTAEIA